MDIAPVYELRTRLRAAMIAGTNLLSEDFRLKKAAESFSVLSGSSPVFKKINDMTAKLLADGSPESLLDTITLVDAVITTLGTSEVKGELEDLPDNGGSTVIVNAPYSQLSAVLDALNGRINNAYAVFLNVRDSSPALLNDYRVKPALVTGLGASFSGLAAVVGSTILGIGKDMLPLLKKDFDPKGKKETVRRVNVIEKMCGAEENDFYLEQLEAAEKDVRAALICALRHDERNIDKLCELVKTEKGKLKKTALYTLGTFDNKQAAAFFEEYAAKKPVEVIGVLEPLSSEWTSRLTAKLFDELLIDADGNKLTLSQIDGSRPFAVKSKIGLWDMCRALKGKYGADIEEIYRNLAWKDNLTEMDMLLGDSIVITGDEGLKRLALELNSKSKMKGGYVYSEAIVRLLGAEECPKWFEKQIKALPKQIRNSPLFTAIKKVSMNFGRFALVVQPFNPITEQCSDAVRPIDESLIYTLSDILMKHFNNLQYEAAVILSNWASASCDTEYVLKILDFLRKNKDKGAKDLDFWINRLIERLKPEGGQ
ncbi:MAG: hypothetical protein K2N38_00315 [Oscillospiraceae bacterium]|nr:hypothetical protein [Oscillospiraceae bacterium]